MIRTCYIAGSGNMAHFLLRSFQRSDLRVSGIYARNAKTGKSLASEFQTEFIPEIESIPDEQHSALFLCVPDRVIETVAASLPGRTNQLLVHSSGNTPISVLATHTAGYGCIWPLASVNKDNLREQSGIPVCVEGSDENASEKLLALARRLSGSVYPMSGTQRSLMHLSAVLTQNFANHLFALAEQLCAANNLDAQLLQPMMREWVAQLAMQKAFELQTGPARRNDENTLFAHRKLLAEQPALLEVYDTLTASIRKMYG